MLKINFEIDDYLLASYVIANYKENRFIPYAIDVYKENIVAFQNLAWKKSEDKYTVIDGRCPIYKYIASLGTSYLDAGHDLEDFIRKLIPSVEFKKIKSQTEKSREKLILEWNRNYNDTLKFIENLGIKADGEYTILLTHPGLKTGNNIGNNKIIWSFQEYWPNYNTVYIWHEILHSHLPHGNKGHALIELITDEEMRIRLNGGSYPPYVGHEYLKKEKDKLLVRWKEYLKNNKKDIQSILNYSF